MSRGRTFLVVLLLLVTAIAAWYWIAPRRAWERFTYGITFGSEADLAATADLPTVRRNFREDVSRVIGERVNLGNGAVAGASAALMDLVVGETITAGGLSRLVAELAMESPDFEPRFRYRSPSRVDVEIGDGSRGVGILTFSRTGLDWKLTRVWGSGFASSQGRR